MDSIIEKAIEKIAHMPNDFHHLKNKSELTLLQESGYFELHDQIYEDEIIKILKKDPNLIAEWLQWSDDSRSSSTWYFTRGDDGICFVGHWPDGKEFEKLITSDEFKACASFIKRQVESTRLLFNK